MTKVNLKGLGMHSYSYFKEIDFKNMMLDSILGYFDMIYQVIDICLTILAGKATLTIVIQLINLTDSS